MDQHIEAIANQIVENAQRGPEGVQLPPAFCQNWPLVKAALEALGQYLPAWARIIIPLIIAVGDKLCRQ